MFSGERSDAGQIVALVRPVQGSSVEAALVDEPFGGCSPMRMPSTCGSARLTFELTFEFVNREMARTYLLLCALVALKLPFNILISQKFHTEYTDQSTSPKLSLNLHNNDQTYFRFANIFYAFTFFDYYILLRSI